MWRWEDVERQWRSHVSLSTKYIPHFKDVHTPPPPPHTLQCSNVSCSYSSILFHNRFAPLFIMESVMMGTYPLSSPETSFLSVDTAIFISRKVRHSKNSVSTFVSSKITCLAGKETESVHEAFLVCLRTGDG